MRLLHTADWHLGARLVERERTEEHAAFLQTLVEIVHREKIDAVLVSGDVFDSANPPQSSIELYYEVLRQLTEDGSTKVVITGGNHDSASHLNAPRGLLRRFGVEVFGHASETAEAAWVDFDRVRVAAVPYLRERDLRRSIAGESSGEAQEQVKRAIRHHYAAVLEAGKAAARGRALVAMGHLTVMGGSSSDSEREIYVGNLGAVRADLFEGFDYTALGHLHRPQQVGTSGKVRYSGSPLPLSFSEASDTKSVTLLEVPAEGDLQWSELILPLPRRLQRVQVDWDQLEPQLEAALEPGSWAEVTVRLQQPEPELDRRVQEAAGDRSDVLKVLTELPAEARPAWEQESPELQALRPQEVFEELLEARGVSEEREELRRTFGELLALEEEERTA